MKLVCLVFVAVTLLSLAGASEATAGFDEGVAAYKAGEFQRAFQEFLPLAQAGVAAAQYNLGLMYASGQGVTKEDAEAVQWFRKAAGQGHGPAQLNLGVMLANGRGVEQDLVHALMWLDVASSSLLEGPARETARKHFKTVAEKMTPAELREARRLSREWKPRKP